MTPPGRTRMRCGTGTLFPSDRRDRTHLCVPGGPHGLQQDVAAGPGRPPRSGVTDYPEHRVAHHEASCGVVGARRRHPAGTARGTGVPARAGGGPAPRVLRRGLLLAERRGPRVGGPRRRRLAGRLPADDDADADLATLVRPALAALVRQHRVLSGLPEEQVDRVRGRRLTEREFAVLTLLGAGLTAQAIARRLNSSPRTVHKHLEHLYRKLGVRDRLMAVQRARDAGLLATPPERGGRRGTADRTLLIPFPRSGDHLPAAPAPTAGVPRRSAG